MRVLKKINWKKLKIVIPMILEFVLVCQPSTVLGINDNVKP